VYENLGLVLVLEEVLVTTVMLVFTIRSLPATAAAAAAASAAAAAGFVLLIVRATFD
jgi:hypothetical protein